MNDGHHFKFNKEVNLGHILTIASFAITMFVVVWNQSSFQARTELELALTKESRERYVPVIQQLMEANKVQDSRFQNIAEALGQIRDAASSSGSDIRRKLDLMQDQINKSQLDLAYIKARARGLSEESDRADSSFNKRSNNAQGN